MRNEYSANIELSTAAHNEDNRKKGKPSREYRKAREQKRGEYRTVRERKINHAQSGILAHNPTHNLALIANYALAVIELVKVFW